MYERTGKARSFIESFSDSISQRVKKDGSEHIDYVPSQVVCEYLAQAFETELGITLGGLIYKSAVNPGGKNLVLFPQHGWETRGFQGAEFVNVIPTLKSRHCLRECWNFYQVYLPPSHRIVL
jgi:hypothetical protein